MTMTLPSKDAAQRYVQQLHFRNSGTPRQYRHLLSKFQHFVAGKSGTEPVTREAIREWLNDRIQVWPLDARGGTANRKGSL